MRLNWYDVPGYEGLYQISESGEIWSLISMKIRKRSYTHDGYQKIELFKDGKRRHLRIHRLLAIMFVPNPHNFDSVNHKDGNKLNNSKDNLEWIKSADNVKHAHQTGLIKQTGTDSWASKLTDRQVLEIRASFMKRKELAKMYGVSYQTVRMILIRKKWKHI